MGTRHKHADLIHAWCEGADIQYKSKGTEIWVEAKTPSWDEKTEYRIKPDEKKPVVRWLWANVQGSKVTSGMYSEEEILKVNPHCIKLEWSRTEFLE